MTEWINKCRTILSSLKSVTGIPYYFERFDGLENQLPDTYIVYFLVDDVGRTWADNKETSHEPQVQVSLFYRDKSTILIVPDQIEKAFMDAGFGRGSPGCVPYQKDTRLYGWYCTFYDYERR